MLQGFGHALKELFTRRCKSCESKEFTISLLNEQLYDLRQIEKNLIVQIVDINKHILHMNNVEVRANNPQVSLQQKSRSIGSRLREAESNSREEAEKQGLSLERTREYQKRVDALLGKEEEVGEE